jgi:hypothetical protein
MTQVLLVALAMVFAVGVSAVLRKRRTDAPTQGSFHMPTQLDRGDFESPQSPWLVAVFTSNKATVLASRDVVVQRIDYTENPELHRRYNIDAVPTLVIADQRGVVRNGFLGPVKAQDLWAAVAECREPGSTPDPCDGRKENSRPE